MRPTPIWPRLALLLRLAVAWYVTQVLAAIFLGTLPACIAAAFTAGPRASAGALLEMVAMAGIGSGFMGGILLFPYTAGALAVWGTVVQTQAAGKGPLGAFHRLHIQAPWLPGEARTELEDILRTLGATSVEARGGCIQARFAPPAWSGRWRRWTHTDEITVDVLPDALAVQVRPTSRLLYEWLWVDRGRNLQRLERLQALVATRMALARRTMQAELRDETQAARLAQAERLLLRAQVEPHFLFNTLAHLRELVRTDDRMAALAMVDALVAHTRTASTQIHRASHALEDEAASLEGYLALVRLRFGDRISTRVEIPQALREVEVPVGALLIPAENAVKHGLEPKHGPGTLVLRAERKGTHLLLEVLDDGVGLSPDPPHGTGLANLRQRLRLSHGESTTLTIEERDTGGVRVRIALPLPV